MSIKLIAGDTASILQVTCVDASTNLPLSLVGHTAAIHFRITKDDIEGALISNPMEITDAANGIATYQFGVGELVEGLLTAEIKITDASGYVLTGFKKLTAIVRAQV